MACAPLPREIIKWLQGLDLSFSIKNPKRDLSNGYIVAEILSRYHPQDVDMNTYENGSRLEAKVDNWEQLYKLFKRKGIGISKAEFDPVIHCAPGAAVMLMHKIYTFLTRCVVQAHAPIQELVNFQHELPSFMRDTASKRLKDPEIARIQDNVERTIVAIDTLGVFHQERRAIKATEAPALIRQERRLRMGLSQEDQSHDINQTDSVVVDEVKVKALQTGSAQLRKTDEKNQEAPPPVATSSRTSLLKAVSSPQTCCAALAGLQQSQAIAKPATEIMRPLVFSIIQESEEFSKMIDTKKEDIVVAFMEQCREGVRDAPGRDVHRDLNGIAAPPLELRMREIEETSVRVFETLAKRAELLVDSLTKSPPEFWKVWTTFYPALADFSESSPIFESALYFFKRLGELMREQDAQLTQQMMTEVALASLAKELARSPEKRELLCEVIYCFVQEDTLNHILTLRALKEKVGDDMAVYVPCLSSLVNLDGQAGLLDEHLLDLYIYYALMAIQSPKPRVRVAGLAIICSVTGWSSQHQPVVALLPHFSALANDEWWEVQAQLLRLSAKLLGRLSTERGHAAVLGPEDDGSASGASRLEDGGEASVEAVIEEILSIVSRLFAVSNSKNVLQVGLSALVHVLPDYPNLLPVFVAVLLGQTPALRQRLLQEVEGDDKAGHTYVHGNFTCTYEETCLPEIWPHLDIAKTLTMQLEASPPERLEIEHLEVLLASLPFFFDEDEADEWLHIFEKVKRYVFTTLVDPQLHLLSTQIIRKFWASGVESIAAKTRENSLDMMGETLSMLYDGSERVEEASVIVFLREMRSRDEDTQAEVDRMIDRFAESHPDKYQASQLHTVSQD
ncbi:SPATA4 [Symbiodinium natans]|uniref:Spermatogenesis-associated protein 4 n=1 Tax=Symbiodinium natans TaxID=878477 RepID=A0A812P7J4_9DINO|nr:SPATA4 [Symbiodinium natans]